VFKKWFAVFSMIRSTYYSYCFFLIHHKLCKVSLVGAAIDINTIGNIRVDHEEVPFFYREFSSTKFLILFTKYRDFEIFEQTCVIWWSKFRNLSK
jgi:hypothetical protein